MNPVTLLDCTLRDGGYYNAWDFDIDLINAYLSAMALSQVDVAEVGLRSRKNESYKGPCAYCSDDFLDRLEAPAGLALGVMVNASELVEDNSPVEALTALFPRHASDTKISLVRIAAHSHEFSGALRAADWLKSRGFRCGVNLMQIAGLPEPTVLELAQAAAASQVDVLYFADSLGSMGPADVARVVSNLREYWTGAIGIHTHDNQGLALSNTLRAISEGVAWVDATVTGMGRGPGNAKTEELALELATQREGPVNIVALMNLLEDYFLPLKNIHKWGTNPYYYLAGKYSIHPTYVQRMLSDKRFSSEDIFAVLDRLRYSDSRAFNNEKLGLSREFYGAPAKGEWAPATVLADREVLFLGTGPSVARNRTAIESYIRRHRPMVIAFNTQTGVDKDVIDFRVACQPVRLLADCHLLKESPQPLITPYSMLPAHIQGALADTAILDYGLTVKEDTFEFDAASCTAPTSLVVAYALAVATSGRAKRITLAGFDGYVGEDPRNREMGMILKTYSESGGALSLTSITNTRYDVPCESVHALS